MTMQSQEEGKIPVTALVIPDQATAGSFHVVGLFLIKGDVFRLAPQMIGCHSRASTGPAKAPSSDPRVRQMAPPAPR